jgi:hypothetical protein
MSNSSKSKSAGVFIIVLAIISFCTKSFSQEKIDCSCPLYKGRILKDRSVERSEAFIVQLAEIKSKRQEVYSASRGTITSIDTISTGRIYVTIEYGDYSFMYDHLLNIQCIAGQTVERGTQLGKLDNGINLLLSISDGSRYVNPADLLPCKIKVIKY